MERIKNIYVVNNSKIFSVVFDILEAIVKHKLKNIIVTF